MSTVLADDLALEALPCRAEDPDLWFSEDPDSIRYAKALCRSCPLVDDCLVRALESREEYGVWGATEPDERHALLRRGRR